MLASETNAAHVVPVASDTKAKAKAKAMAQASVASSEGDGGQRKHSDAPAQQGQSQGKYVYVVTEQPHALQDTFEIVYCSFVILLLLIGVVRYVVHRYAWPLGLATYSFLPPHRTSARHTMHYTTALRSFMAAVRLIAWLQLCRERIVQFAGHCDHGGVLCHSRTGSATVTGHWPLATGHCAGMEEGSAWIVCRRLCIRMSVRKSAQTQSAHGGHASASPLAPCSAASVGTTARVCLSSPLVDLNCGLHT